MFASARALALLLAVGAAVAGFAQSETDAPTSIGIGSPAPELRLGSSLKGEALEALPEGKIVVVEFWATWCGPCIDSIPHITEVAKRFSDDVVVLGVNIWEGSDPETNLTRATRFVENMGERMDYHVAMDTDDEHMATHWMAAAGQNGIPAAIVVDRDGAIAWIGHPMGEMESVLEQMIAGTFDRDAAAAEFAASQAREARFDEVFSELQGLLVAGEFAEVAKRTADLRQSETDSQMLMFASMFEFQALVQFDLEKLEARIEESVADESEIGEASLFYAGMAILNMDEVPDAAKPLALKASEALSQRTNQENLSAEDLYSRALHVNGQHAQAIEAIDRAIKLSEQFESFPETYLNEMKARRELYRAALEE